MAVDPEIQEATKFRDRDGEIARERQEDGLRLGAAIAPALPKR